MLAEELSGAQYRSLAEINWNKTLILILAGIKITQTSVSGGGHSGTLFS